MQLITNFILIKLQFLRLDYEEINKMKLLINDSLS